MIQRPKTRGDCIYGVRPCPWVGCRYHLWTHITGRGELRPVFRCQPWELTESCTLDVADRGGSTLEEVGLLMNITRERVRQVELKAKMVIRGILFQKFRSARDSMQASAG